MGWASGSNLAEQMYDEIRKHIPVKKRKVVARAILENFEGNDADDWDYGSALLKDADRPEDRVDAGYYDGP